MANETIYPFGISGEQSEGIWSERIAEMQANIDMLAPWAYRDEPSTPIYSIESSVTTQNYDTGVKLFDEPKSFTILCVATFNNYNWSATTSVQSILGISTDNYFRVGKIYQGVNYNNNISTGTDNWYFAVAIKGKRYADRALCYRLRPYYKESYRTNRPSTRKDTLVHRSGRCNKRGHS